MAIFNSSQNVSQNSFVRPSLPGDLFLGMFFNAQISSSSDIKNSDLVDCSSVRQGTWIELKNWVVS